MKYIVKNINSFKQIDIDNFYDEIIPSKKEIINKLKNTTKKKQSIIGELLLKELLKKNKINYNNINYYINEDGKPYLLNNSTYFNISHSYDYVIVTTSNKEIGIDIEKIRKTKLNVINRFATIKEKEYILSSNEDILKRLFQIYTLKEAYFKMKGTNLKDILNVEFEIHNDRITCSDKSVNAFFIHDINDYIISYCEKN